jgi:hypothetical protein
MENTHTNESTFSIKMIKDRSFLLAHCCVESSCMTTGSEISSKPASDSWKKLIPSSVTDCRSYMGHFWASPSVTCKRLEELHNWNFPSIHNQIVCKK